MMALKMSQERRKAGSLYQSIPVFLLPSSQPKRDSFLRSRASPHLMSEAQLFLAIDEQ
jgi:hypothetical protein